MSLSILLLYTSLINITETTNIKTPSINEYSQLYNLHGQKLTCDCTQISIYYQKFIQIQYRLHQVCYSDFVTQEWIDYLATMYGYTNLLYDDFRVTGTFAFQALNAFCVLVNQTISNRLIQFYSSQYVSASVTPSDVFQLQTEAFISQFILSTTNDFLSSLSMIRKTTQSNSLLPGELTNFRVEEASNQYIDTYPQWYGNCTCGSSATCVSESSIYDLSSYTVLFYVPDFYIGCYTIESLLQSSLQCFYNQTCINELQSYFLGPSLMNVTSLNISSSIRFVENSTINDLLDQLVVEEWNSSSMYDNYYSECQPKQCSYTLTTNNSAIYIITTIIGLVGGLITVLILIVPRLVVFVRKRKELERAEAVMNFNESVRTLYQKSKLSFQNLNIFSSVPPAIDEYQLRNQRFSTRLFIFLLIISLSILLLYTSLINKTETVNVKAPSINEYSQLYNLHGQTLTCGCTQISINYEKFIQIQYRLHQVCYSDFVTQDWFDYLTTSAGNFSVPVNDFRLTSSFAFQALNAFCVLVNETISNRLIQFYSSQYVSASVTPSNVFQLQTEAFISQFILSTTNDFLLSLSMIRKTTQSNSLFSGELTNYAPYLVNDVLVRNPQSYGDCTCSSSATCIVESAIYDLSNGKTLFYVPDFYIGCYTIESLLQSSLQCFYNQNCIYKLQSYFLGPSLMNVASLNISSSIRFVENSTINDLLDQLMVEEWNSSSMYDNYYSECQPEQCTYTLTTKNSAIYITTTIIGLLGGLITVLKFSVPSLVDLIMYFCIKKRKDRRVTVMPTIQA